MADSAPTLRLAYIRTVSDPHRSHEDTYAFLRDFVRQEHPDTWTARPKHRFLFGASNLFDSHILDVFISGIPAGISGNFRTLQKSDLELRISRSHANTPAGTAILNCAKTGGIVARISGKDDDECEEIMLQQCDYLIDPQTTSLDYVWYWNNARTGTPQDNMLTNSKYDVSKHDVSLTRLRDRYGSRGWTPSSGAFHGNMKWRCRCGAMCKRGRCKVFPAEERDVPEYFKMPQEGSKGWAELTSNDVCDRFRWQKRSRTYQVDDVLLKSIDTFSGE